MTISRFCIAVLSAMLALWSGGLRAQSQMVENVHISTLKSDSLAFEWDAVEKPEPLYQVRVEINDVTVFLDSTTNTKALYLPQPAIGNGDHVVVAVKEVESPGFTTVDVQEVVLPGGGSNTPPIIIVDVIYMKNTECPPLVINNNVVTLCPNNETEGNGYVRIMDFEGPGRNLLVKRSKICGCLSATEINYWQYFSSCLVRP